MFNSIIQNIKGFILGAVICSVAWNVYYLTRVPKISKTDSIATTKSSGAKVNHSQWNFSGDSMTFQTDAEGVGSSTTSVPKRFIPEAKAYLENTDIIQGDIYFMNINGKFNQLFGCSYYHRWNDLSIGGGIVVSKKVLADKIYGVKLSAQYGF
ncbi:MAG TPA: hypothetical protein PKK43_08475 [Spirochaetota bacterium]|nr:hypothetical protein [Spirochaetota bacterium]